MPDGGGGGGGVSMSINGQSKVPPGFRFHPTEEELLQYYLRKKVGSLEIDLDVIVEVDLNKLEPWDIQEKCAIGSTPQNDWYFFSHKDKKYPTGTRTNRATAAGFWKATGRDKVIYGGGRRIGMRKTLVFYKGRAPHGQKSDWIMHEYRLIDVDHNGTNATSTTPCSPSCSGTMGVETGQEEGWVVCKIFKKKHLINHNHHNNKSPLRGSISSSNIVVAHPVESYPSGSDCCDGVGALEQIFQQTTHQLINTTNNNNNNNNRVITAQLLDDEDHNNNNNAKGMMGNYSRTAGGFCNDNFMKLPSLESPNSNADHCRTKGSDQLAYDGNSNGSYDHLNNLSSSSDADRSFKVGVGGTSLVGGGGGFSELINNSVVVVGGGGGYSDEITGDDDDHDGLSDWGTIDLLLSSHLNGQPQNPLPPPPPLSSSTSPSSTYYLHHHHNHHQQPAAAGQGGYFAATVTSSGGNDQINEAWDHLITSSRSSLLSSSDLLL